MQTYPLQPVRQVRREAEGDARRRRLAARSLDPDVRQRHEQFEPARAQVAADRRGGRRRRPASTATVTWRRPTTTPVANLLLAFGQKFGRRDGIVRRQQRRRRPVRVTMTVPANACDTGVSRRVAARNDDCCGSRGRCPAAGRRPAGRPCRGACVAASDAATSTRRTWTARRRCTGPSATTTSRRSSCCSASAPT